jgi:hypothetical protein
VIGNDVTGSRDGVKGGSCRQSQGGQFLVIIHPVKTVRHDIAKEAYTGMLNRHSIDSGQLEAEGLDRYLVSS